MGRKNLVFNISPNPGFFTQFGIPLGHSFIPQILSPTNIFHRTIKNELKKIGIRVEENKFPYRIRVEALAADVTLNIQVRIFPPNIVSLTVELSGLHTQMEPKAIIKYQQLDLLKPIIDVVRLTMSMVETLSHKNIRPSQAIRYRPAVHLEGITSSDRFIDYVDDNMTEYIGILIHHDEYEFLKRHIINEIREKKRKS